MDEQYEDALRAQPVVITLPGQRPRPARAAEEGGVHARARPLALPHLSPIPASSLSCISLPLKQRSQAESVNTEGKIARMVFVFVDGPLYLCFSIMV